MLRNAGLTPEQTTLLNNDHWVEAFFGQDKAERLAAYCARLRGAEISGDALRMISEHHKQKNAPRIFYPQIHTGGDLSRFPLLESMRQQLSRHYPLLDKVLNRGSGKEKAPTDARHIQINLSIGHHPKEMAALFGHFIQTPALRAYRLEKRSAYLPFEAIHLISGEAANVFRIHDQTDVLLVSDVRYISDTDSLRENGTIIVNSPFSAAQTWDRIQPAGRRHIRAKNIRLFTVNATETATRAARTPAQQAWHMMLALCGAFAAVMQEPGAPDRALKVVLNRTAPHSLLSAFEEGKKSVRQTYWAQLPAYESLKAPDTLPTPWAISKNGLFDKTVFDPAYFWDTVGYLYREEEQDNLLTDPMVAVEALPARTSTFRDLSPSHTYIPRFDAENCSACGLCWANCPESALPTVVFTVEDLWQAAVTRAGEKNHTLQQLKRLQSSLIKMVHKRAKESMPRDIRHAGTLFSNAFDFMIEKLNADEATEETLRSEFNGVLPYLERFPLVRSAAFFDHTEQEKSGTGRLLSIVINPYTCKGCSACIAICPDNALTRIEARPDVIDNYKRQFTLLTALPENRQSTFDDYIQQTDRPDGREVYRLINRQAYFSMPGGDNGLPGSGVKTALHLTLSAFETLLQPRRREWLEQLNTLIHKLETRSQNLLNEAVDINSFDDFYQRLMALDDHSEGIGALIAGEEAAHKTSRARTRQLKEFAALIKALKEDRAGLQKGSDGYGAAPMGLVFHAEGSLSWMADYPYNPFAYPWLNRSGSQLTESARGMFDGMVRQLLPIINHMRQAVSLLEGKRTPWTPAHRYEELTEKEKSWCPRVLVIMNSDTFHQQYIRSFATHQRPIHTVVINSDTRNRFDPALWALGMTDRPVLQLSPGHHGNMLRFIRETADGQLPVFIFADANEPYRQGIAEDRAWEQHQRAVATRVFPVWRYRPDNHLHYGERFDLSANPAPEDDWVEIVLERTATTPPERITYRLTPADWAARESAWQNEFRPIAPSEWSDRWFTVADYLELPEKEQANVHPYIIYKDEKERLHKLAVSEKVIDLCRLKKAQWYLLRQLAGVIPYDPAYQETRLRERINAALDEQKQNLSKSYEERLRQLEQEHFSLYHARLKEKLLKLYRQKTAAPDGGETERA
ncbi:MAG: hypothetical protein D6677_04605 [Calditrichaeota bacterium]|nr:MAG: hypothetical protein D6677_04605 [Calditrichota bacterium]